MEEVKNPNKIPVDIYRQVFYIALNFGKNLDEKRRDILLEVLKRLGMKDSRNRLKKIFAEKTEPTTVANHEKSKQKGRKGKKGPPKKGKQTSPVEVELPPLNFEFEMPKSTVNLKLPNNLTDSRFQMVT